MKTGRMSVGLGYDSHRLTPNRPLILGGVRVPAEMGLSGHSDADVLIHAIIDALLGAAGRGNIGEAFPDSDPAYREADSLVLLGTVWAGLRSAGYRLGHVDCVILAEQPRLAPYLAEMKRRLAETLEVQESAISVKPKTNEAMGAIGRGEGMAAMAVVLLERSSSTPRPSSRPRASR